MTQFVPLKTFEHKNKAGAKSRYLEGMAYTVRPGNDELAGYVQDWLAADPPLVTLSAAAVAAAPNRLASGAAATAGTLTTGPAPKPAKKKGN